MDKLIKVLEKLKDFHIKEVEFSNFRAGYLSRLKSMKNVNLKDNEMYSKKYYKFRVNKFGLTNKLRNYHLTNKMSSTMKITSRFLYTDAEYYKFLVKRFDYEVSVSKVDVPALITDIKNYIFS